MNTDFKIQRPDQIVNVREHVHEKKKVHIGRVRVQPGQTLWELNIGTGEIEAVKYNVTAINLDGSISSEVITKENCLYAVAVNKKNASRKFILMCKKITAQARANKI